MPELFASLNFSANSYFPSFISISNLKIKGGHAGQGRSCRSRTALVHRRRVGYAPRSDI